MAGARNLGAPRVRDSLCLTYVLNADGTPLMPCHPARARELVRRGRARWVRRDTIRLAYQIENPGLQPVIVGQDMGDTFIGTAAIILREKSRARVAWREVAMPRSAEEISKNLSARRNYRRGRRARKCGYRKPRMSPTRRVGLTARLYDRRLNLIRRLPLREARRLLRKSPHEIRRWRGNSFLWLTGHKPKAPEPDKINPKTDFRVFRGLPGGGRKFCGIVPVEGDKNTVEKEAARVRESKAPETGVLRRLLGFSKKRSHGPLARLEDGEDGPVLVLLSERAERFLTRKALRPLPPLRTLGQLRRPKGWLPPSGQSLAAAHLGALRRVSARLPVSHAVLETARFDVARLNEGRVDVRSDRWGQRALAKQNRKDFVLARDGWRCVWCGRSGLGQGGVPLTIDHIVPRNPRAGRRGTDRTTNLVCACEECNTKRSNRPVEEWLRLLPARRETASKYLKKLGERDRDFRAQARLAAAKSRVSQEAAEIAPSVRETFGFATKRMRIAMGLEKAHDLDAVAMAAEGRGVSPVMPPVVYLKAKRYGGSANRAGRRQRFNPQPQRKEKAITRRGGVSGQYRLIQGQYFMITEVNRETVSPAGTVRKGDLILAVTGGRMVRGTVTKILSSGRVGIDLAGETEKAVAVSKVIRVLRKRTGWVSLASPAQATVS